MKKLLVLFLGTLMLTSCGGEASYPKRVRGEAQAVYGEQDKAFGDDALNIFNNKEEKENVGLGINAFLWRATLSTVSFMPITSADPFGGVILTDWYSPEGDYRYKLNIFIMDKQLRADGVNVSVFKQEKNNAGEWVDVATSDEMATKIEDSILTKARKLKIRDTK